MRWPTKSFPIAIVLIAPIVLCSPIASNLFPRADDSPSCSPLQIQDRDWNSTDSSPGNNGTDDSTQWDATPDLTRRAPVKPLSGEDWDVLVQKGRTLWGRLQAALNDPPTEPPPVCDLHSRWDVSANLKGAYGMDSTWENILPSHALPINPVRSFYHTSLTSPKAPDPDRPPPPIYMYRNAMSPKYGFIEAEDIRGWWEGKIVDGQSRRAPDRWSDATWALWVDICLRTQQDPYALRWILQNSVVNPQSKQIIDRTLDIRYPKHTDWDQFNDIHTPDDDTFYALLSSPNAVGTLYMLLANAKKLGKSIRSIGVYRASTGAFTKFPHMLYHMYVELRKVAPGGGGGGGGGEQQSQQGQGTVQTS